jgi:hypothetical protein
MKDAQLSSVTYQLDNLDQHPIVTAPSQDGEQLRCQWQIIPPSLTPSELHHNANCSSHNTLILILQFLP